MKIKVGIIFGGRSGEHEVSLVSATSVRNEMPKDKYELREIGISKDGKWYMENDTYTGDDGNNGNDGNNNNNGLIEKFKDGSYTEMTSVSFDAALNGCDIIFSVLHGPYGEDGTIQGVFEMMNLPYVGCGVLASSLCMDKINAKRVLSECGIPVVPYVAFSRTEWMTTDALNVNDPNANNPNANDSNSKSFTRETIIEKIKKELSLPLFIKPSNMGSSVGISKVKEWEELESAVDEACKYDTRILVEKGVDAREIECAVLGNDDPKAASLGEIVVGGEFYDYNDKYVDGKSHPEIPVKNLNAETQAKICDFCLRGYKALGCSGLSRVDSFIDRKTGEIYLNEINTLPGFTSISMYPKMWANSGIAFPDLLDQLIQLGFEKFKEKSSNKIGFDLSSDWFKTP